MERYDKDAICPKCGFGHLTSDFEEEKWHYPHVPFWWYQDDNKYKKKRERLEVGWLLHGDRMKRECPNCKYVFFQLPHDAPTGEYSHE
jgi:rubredoxin